jgi:hypothetical protein
VQVVTLEPFRRVLKNKSNIFSEVFVWATSSDLKQYAAETGEVFMIPDALARYQKAHYELIEAMMEIEAYGFTPHYRSAFNLIRQQEALHGIFVENLGTPGCSPWIFRRANALPDLGVEIPISAIGGTQTAQVAGDEDI